MSPLSPLLQGLFFSYWSWWPALPVPVQVLGFPILVFFISVFILCSLFVSFIYLYLPCPSLNCPVGLCFWTHDVTSDWLPSGFPPRLPGHCRLVLTGSHDSLFLWYPAIDIVWLGPVFLALGSPSDLALRDSAWCSLESWWVWSSVLLPNAQSDLPDSDT